MNSASRRTPSISSPLRPRQPLKQQQPQRDIWGLGLSSDLLPDEEDHPIFAAPRRGSKAATTSTTAQTPSRQASLRRRTVPGSNPSTPKQAGQAGAGDDDLHPLFRMDSPPRRSEDSWAEVLGDVTRPNLTRLTSDLERRAGGSSRGGGSEDGASGRGSMERSRMRGNGDAEAASGVDVEVEVLLHQVQPNESLAGIALLYGIDLATLRKTNKLWASDTVHLRRHLYVPLEACRWNNAREILVRGPGEGQVTLLPRTRNAATIDKGKGKAKEGSGTVRNLIDLTDEPVASATPESGLGGRELGAGGASDPGHSTRIGRNAALAVEEFDPWTEGPGPPEPSHKHPSLPLNGTASPDSLETRSINSADTARPPGSEPGTGHQEEGRTVDIVRIPASQLRFFPKAPRQSTTDSSRTSLDSGPRSGSALRPLSQPVPTAMPPLSIQNDLHFSHDPPPSTHKSTRSVRLRPPTSAPSSGTGLADKLSNLFYVPPPPSGGLSAPPPILPPPPRQPRVSRPSLDSSSARSSPRLGRSARSSAAGSPTRLAMDELELQSRETTAPAQGAVAGRRGSADTFKVKRSGNGERRKLD